MYFNRNGLVVEDQGDKLLYIAWSQVRVIKAHFDAGKPWHLCPIPVSREAFGYIGATDIDKLEVTE